VCVLLSCLSGFEVAVCFPSPRSLRHVTKHTEDKPIHDEAVSEVLLRFFWALQQARGRAVVVGDHSLEQQVTSLRSVQTQHTGAQEMHEGKVVVFVFVVVMSDCSRVCGNVAQYLRLDLTLWSTFMS